MLRAGCSILTEVEDWLGWGRNPTRIAPNTGEHKRVETGIPEKRGAAA
jgi:hypothetical protein